VADKDCSLDNKCEAFGGPLRIELEAKASVLQFINILIFESCDQIIAADDIRIDVAADRSDFRSF